MDTILNVATAHLEKNGPTEFKELWEVVSAKLSDKWAVQFPKKKEKDIQGTKMTEFYTLLTISGAFIRTQEGKFGLVKTFTYKDVQTMKVRVGELED